MLNWIPHEPFGWPVYSILLGLSLLLGSMLCWRRWKRRGLAWKPLLLALACGVSLLFLGAKVFYLWQFGWSWSLHSWSGPGMSLYGGLCGLMVGWAIACYWNPFPFRVFLDCATPSLALGLFLTRIGCFLHGCNGGIPTALPWAVRFPPGSASYLHQWRSGLIAHDSLCSLPAHPTQLYESLFGLTLFVGMKLFSRFRFPSGFLFAGGIGSYALFRFLTEPLRADHNGRLLFGQITFGQAVSIFALLLSLGLVLLGFRSDQASSNQSGFHPFHSKENSHASGL